MSEAWPYVVVLCGAVVTYFWRGLGVALAGRLRTDGPVIAWVTCVAYALLAALIARMLLLPIGPLAEASLWSRLGGVAAAAAVYAMTRGNVLAGVTAGCSTLVVVDFLT